VAANAPTPTAQLRRNARLFPILPPLAKEFVFAAARYGSPSSINNMLVAAQK
jgi:hypothetical protein